MGDVMLTLRMAKGAKLKTAPELNATPAQCGALVRRGLLESFEQSEQVRGERRTYYKLYRITEAGLTALQSEPQNG